MFGLKLLSFVGATANTVGFLTFFFWEGLVPYRWQLILGGTAIIAVAELLSYWLVKRVAATPEAD